MRFKVLLPALYAALVATTVAASARTIEAERTLAMAQSRPLLEYACVHVAISIGALPRRTVSGDASVAALRKFVLSKRSVNVRAWCLRNARNLGHMEAHSAYAADLAAIEFALLTSHGVNEELVGARAAWCDLNVRTGRLLVRLARPDRPADVRIAALRNLNWPMKIDIVTEHDGRVYARVIDRALHDDDDRIVVAGLLAYSMLYQASADTTLLAYARSHNPVLRAGVFEALSGRTVIDGTDSRLFALGLRDPDIRVRSAALVALRVPTRADLRRLATFAEHAPTPQDRQNAHVQMDAFRTFKPFI
jgi:hypothetical protein